MPFPFAKSAAPFMFTITRADGSPPDPLDLTQLRVAAEDNMLMTRVPPRLNDSDEYVWGWSWLDDKNPISAGCWLAWQVRAWVKTPPRTLLEAMVEAAVRKELAENPDHKVDSAWREEKRDEIAKTLRSLQPPKIEETPLAVDVSNGRVLLFSGSEKNRTALLERLRRIFEPAMGLDLIYTPWNLDTYLLRTRPQAVLPQELGEKFVTWLMGQARHSRWLEISQIDDSEPTFIQLVLDGRVVATTEDGTISVTGDKAAEHYVDQVEAENNAQASAVRIYMRVKGGKNYTVTVDRSGYLTGCKLADATAMKRKEDNLEAAVLDRADRFADALAKMQLVFAAFDYGPLSEWMEAMPQRQLFPGAPTGRILWHESDRFGDDIDGEVEDDGAQVKLVDDDASVEKMARVVLLGSEWPARMDEHGFDKVEAAAYRDDNLELVLGWYTEGGWPRLLVGLSDVVPKAKRGQKSIRRVKGRIGLDDEITVDGQRAVVVGLNRAGPNPNVVVDVYNDVGDVLSQRSIPLADLEETSAASVRQPSPSAPDPDPDPDKAVDYEATWQTMLAAWREEVGVQGGFNLNAAQKKAKTTGPRRKLVDAYMGRGWDGVRSTLVSMGVPMRKGRS